jgi:conjugal transfer/type IV secretion protein DotA/TraY
MRTVMLLLLTAAAMAALPVPAALAATGLSSVPHVDVPAGDLSSSLLTQIFGANWANLAGGGPEGGAPTLIFQLLKTLNSLCAIAVAWMVIFTTIVGAVGAANEGKALSGKHSSPWVPIRFAFSFSAIAPVFAGLNAMQIVILAGIGMSINMADKMWKTGLDYIAEYGVVNADTYASPIRMNSRKLAAGAFESVALLHYLSNRAACDVGIIDGKWYYQAAKDVNGNDVAGKYIFLIKVPEQCRRGRTNLQPGDLGGFSFRKTDLGPDVEGAAQIDAVKMSAIRSLLPDVDDAARKLGEISYTDRELPVLFQAAENYTARLASSLGKVAMTGDVTRRAAMEKLVSSAETLGWFMAGSYYWVLVEANNKTVKAMADTAEYIEPDMEALQSTTLIKEDWITHAVPNIRTVNGQLSASIYEASGGKDAIKSTGNWYERILDSLGFLSEMPARFVANLSRGSPDAVLTYATTARYILQGLEVATATFLGLRAAGAGASNSIVGKVANVTGIGSALNTLSDGAWTLFLILMVPLYLAFWTFAWIIPAIPFLTWLACIVGWLVLSVEAVIAAPIWLVGHCMPEGDGFAGASGRNGYALFLSVLLRPVLLVLSMFICLALMCATGMLISALFEPFLDATGIVFGNLGIGAAVGIMLVLGTAITLLTWKMFELTTAMPDRIIRWVGQLLAPLDDEARGLARESVHENRQSARTMISDGMQARKGAKAAAAGRAQGETGGVTADAKVGAQDALRHEAQFMQKDAGERE